MTTQTEGLIFPNLPEITITRNKYQNTAPKKESKSLKKDQDFRLTSSGHGNEKSPDKKFIQPRPSNKSIKKVCKIQNSIQDEMSNKNKHSSHLDSYIYNKNDRNSGTVYEANICNCTRF